MTRMTEFRDTLVGLTIVALMLWGSTTYTLQQEPTIGCASAGRDGTADTDLYCIELFHRPDFPEASGHVELGRVPSPFGTRVSTAGNHEFDVTIAVDGLPDPSSVGPYTTYVAWATTPLLSPMVNLGSVGNGRTRLGRVGFDKFLILITAEVSADVDTYQGRLVLRGISASMRMEPEDLLQLTGIVANLGHNEASEWSPPRPHPLVEMMPGVGDLRPIVTPYLPPTPIGGSVSMARPREIIRLQDGGTLDLEAGVVTRTIGGRTFTMFGFNGQYPGPLIRVPEDATVTVNVINRLDLPTAIHWHGIRLDNRYDGVPGVTQNAIQPGDSFQYRIHFPDAGLYWYHPHHREDIQQDLGLYGNMRVDSTDPAYYGPANYEETLMLDDLLTTADGLSLLPYGKERATHALMGRFGNLLLVNGEPGYRLTVKRGAVVRFFLTNVSNTRTFNLSFGNAAIKLVASDVGKFEHETWVDSVVIAPAERYIVDVRFPEAGSIQIVNSVQGIDHVFGNFFPEAMTLGEIVVSESWAMPDHATSFDALRVHGDVVADIDRYRSDFDRPVDRRLLLTLAVQGLPYPLETLLNLDSSFFNPVEWSGTMPRMNWVTTGDQVEWVLRDEDTGRENLDIDWSFRMGDRVKIRLRNDRTAIHAMQHPIHLHGQRFLVLSQDGLENNNLVWKDTMLLPVGSTADILLDVSNPGRWMLHCHIAEHLESGMKLVFDVSP